MEAGFTSLIGGYRRTLDVALRHQFITLLVFLATVSLTVFLYIIIPKGFFPDAGHRYGDRRQRGRAGCLVQGDDARPAGARRHRVPGPGRDVLRLDDRCRRRRPDREQRTHLYRTEALGPAHRRQRAGLHQPHPPEAGGGDRGRALPAGGAGHPRRRPAVQDRVPVHAAGRRSGRAVQLGAEDAGRAAAPADAARRGHRPADRRHHRHADHRPRCRGALRHPAAGDRRHAVRRVRAAPDDAVLLAGELLPPDPGGAARRRIDRRDAEQAVREISQRAGGAAVHLRQMVHAAGGSRCRSTTRASSRR